MRMRTVIDGKTIIVEGDGVLCWGLRYRRSLNALPAKRLAGSCERAACGRRLRVAPLVYRLRAHLVARTLHELARVQHLLAAVKHT